MEKRFWIFLNTPLGKRVATFVAIIIWVIFMSTVGMALMELSEPFPY